MPGTVLVVDDDPSVVDLLRDALSFGGYQVLVSVNGAALQVARDHHPDLILLDIAMPGMDGVEVSQRLRADPTTMDIPLVAMSAQSRLQASASMMLVDDELPKPFELARLFATVARWIQAP